ncbi:MAG: C40 family peptidase [Desulfobacterales bacterium]|nr:C40 family peptidase [Desulfobacterales bacterium]MBF0395294.1 C40 family peptidase [Desulfobacterales bacterium]
MIRFYRRFLFLTILSMIIGMLIEFKGTAIVVFPDALSSGIPCDSSTLIADFEARDALPESDIPQSDWYTKNWNNGWGPKAATYPTVQIPAGCDPVKWKRDRVIAVARKYLGLRYQHHHIPGWNPPVKLTRQANESRGLDCSNFTAWVYNFSLGIRFTSDVQDQGDGAKAPGRRLAPNEPFAPGDLLFILKQDRSEVSHVVIYINKRKIIDSHRASNGVTEHEPKGWYKTHFAYARRIIE